MSNKYREQTEILRQERIAPDIFSLWVRTEKIAADAVPGQFLSVYCDEESRLLPRPLSICETDGAALRLVYRVAGAGTREFSEKKAGDSLRVLGPLGNGFPLQEKKAILIGGGIGIPPMLELAKRYPGEKQIVLGYNDENTFLADEFIKLTKEAYGREKERNAREREPVDRGGEASHLGGEVSAYGGQWFGRCAVSIATTDGSVGTKGTVLDAIAANGLSAEVFYACGPTPMLRAVKEYATARDKECWLSLEERMACGIGACLSCVCHSTEADGHSKVKNKRVCKDGPVFEAREVRL